MGDINKSKGKNGIKNKFEKGRIIENSNIMIPDDSEDSDDWGGSEDYIPKKRAQGLPKNHQPQDLYCCICSKRHHEENCN